MGTLPIKSEFCKRVTQKLREMRIAAGYNCREVRSEADIDVNKIENNESNLSVYTLRTLLTFYGKTLAIFFIELEKETEDVRKYSAKTGRKQMKAEKRELAVNIES